MRTPFRTLPAALLLAALALVARAPARADGLRGPDQPTPLPHLDYQHFVLPNGLRVYVLPDHSLPQAQVITWFRVGSADERPGRTGFAHLFEHLMFKGSAHIPDGKMDVLLEGAGGWSNAFTSSDMTVYFDTAASNFLPDMLWIEADRLAGLTDTIDQKKLDNQRAVVLNERRQSYENRPYGKAPLLLRKALWPAGHGYHWPVIGYHKDLAAASVDDVKKFFHTWYVPNNATLVIAGDVTLAEVKPLVEKYYGWIPKHADPVPPGYEVLPPMKGSKTLTATDKVQVPRVYLAWRGPKSYSKDEAPLDLAARILGGGKSSRLYKELVYRKQVAQDVSASFDSEMLGGEFDIVITAKPGVDPQTLAAAAMAAVAKLAKRAPSKPELERAQNGHEARFLGQLQSSLWRGVTLAGYDAQAGDAAYLAKDVDRYRNVKPKDVSRVVAKWLGPDAWVELTISPAKAGTAGKPAKAVKEAHK